MGDQGSDRRRLARARRALDRRNVVLDGSDGLQLRGVAPAPRTRQWVSFAAVRRIHSDAVASSALTQETVCRRANQPLASNIDQARTSNIYM